jgi:hypothetical protein
VPGRNPRRIAPARREQFPNQSLGTDVAMNGDGSGSIQFQRSGDLVSLLRDGEAERAAAVAAVAHSSVLAAVRLPRVRAGGSLVGIAPRK